MVFHLFDITCYLCHAKILNIKLSEVKNLLSWCNALASLLEFNMQFICQKVNNLQQFFKPIAKAQAQGSRYEVSDQLMEKSFKKYCYPMSQKCQH